VLTGGLYAPVSQLESFAGKETFSGGNQWYGFR